MRIRSLTFLGCFASIAAIVVSQQSCTSTGNTPAGDAGATNEAGGGSDAGAATWTIGVSNSLTGGLSSTGSDFHNAWSVAENYINSNGGILGKNVSFIEIDDGSDDSTASDDGGLLTKVYSTLIGDKVAGIVGPQGSAQAETIEGLTFNAQMISISASATSTLLAADQPEDGGRFFFRTVPADDLQGKALAKLANLGPASFLGDAGAGAGSGDDGGGSEAGSGSDAGPATGLCPTIAMFYYSDSYGTPMEAVFKQHYTGSVVAEVQVDDTVKADYSTEVATVKAANPACLGIIVYDDVGDAFLRQLRTAYGGTIPFPVMGTDGVYDSAFLTNGLTSASDPANTTVAEGSYGTSPDTNPPDSPDYQFFKTLYLASFPFVPDSGQTDLDPYVANEFDAAMLIALAIQQAGGVSDRVKLRDALLSISSGTGKAHGASSFTQAISDIQNGIAIDYAGASGPCVIDPATGNVSAGYIVWHVVNGNFVTLTHLKAAEL